YTHNRLATCHLSSLSSHYLRPPPRSPLFPYTTLFRSTQVLNQQDMPEFDMHKLPLYFVTLTNYDDTFQGIKVVYDKENLTKTLRSEEHTSELQSRENLVCRLLLEKKKQNYNIKTNAYI